MYIALDRGDLRRAILELIDDILHYKAVKSRLRTLESHPTTINRIVIEYFLRHLQRRDDFLNKLLQTV